MDLGCGRLSRVLGRGGARRAQKVVAPGRADAVGIPEHGNMPGMMPVLSLPFATVILGRKTDFWTRVPKVLFSLKIFIWSF